MKPEKFEEGDEIKHKLFGLCKVQEVCLCHYLPCEDFGGGQCNGEHLTLLTEKSENKEKCQCGSSEWCTLIKRANQINPNQKEKVMPDNTEIPAAIAEVYENNSGAEMMSVARHFPNVNTGNHNMDVVLFATHKESILVLSKKLDEEAEKAEKGAN